jgi:preprotein translocase subunit YajC
MIETLLLLAQADPTATPTTSPQPGGLQQILYSPFVPLGLMLIVMFWMMSAGRRKEQRRFQDMLSALKRNDRVLTIGGIVGTVVEVRDDVVILKVDETNNVKMQFLRSAVKEVLRESAGASTTK